MHEFYEIITEKSQILDRGLKKKSYACKANPNLFLFIWRNEEEDIRHFQLIFGENFLSWHWRDGLDVGHTNRFYENPVEIGSRKGTRSLLSSKEDALLKKAFSIIEESNFPEKIGEDILIRVTDSLNI